jgi:hypothetical protein
MTETQGKTEIDNINQDKEQTQPTNLQSPKAGTATSSPVNLASSPTNKVFATRGHMKKQGFAETTIKAMIKSLGS